MGNRQEELQQIEEVGTGLQDKTKDALGRIVGKVDATQHTANAAQEELYR